MCNIPPLGAFIKGTNEYIYPKIASKENKYECPSCHNDLIVKKGSVRVHHFAHRRSDNPCNYYSGPSESDIHKDAKILLKTLLERKTKIIIKRKCCGDYVIPLVTDSVKILLEYRFDYNGPKVADVVFIDDDSYDACVWGKLRNVRYIFEICHSHRTEKNNRPEPWFEINASKLLVIANSHDDIVIKCIRRDKCAWCTAKDDLFKLEPRRTIYLDVPYKDRDEAKNLGLWFDFHGRKKWMMLSNSRNKNKILSTYNVINYIENDINKKHETIFIRDLIKFENRKHLDLFVRIKLGQNSFFPTPILRLQKDFDSPINSKFKYIYSFNGPHLRFEFDSHNNLGKIKKNKNLIDSFNDYFFGYRCIIYSQKHLLCAYIINSSDLHKYDYYGYNFFDNRSDINGYHIPFPFLYCEEYTMDDTITIIKHLFYLCAFIYDYFHHSTDPFAKLPDYIPIPKVPFSSTPILCDD